jgi:hypothetical protein
MYPTKVEGMDRCCINCFNDEYLKQHIKEEGSPGKCTFCGSRSRYCIEPEKLYDLFQPVMNLYSAWEDFMPTYDMKNRDGDFIWEKLDNDWGIFEGLSYADQERFMYSMFSGSYGHDEGPPLVLSSWVDRESEYHGTDDSYSDKLKAEWDAFCDEIVSNNRYFPKNEINLETLSELLVVLSSDIKRGAVYYRARTSEGELKYPCSKMGKPPVEKSKSGRANPRGIAYLYLASDAKTAISEVRPTVSEMVTVGEFRAKENLRVANLISIGISPFKYGDMLEYYLRHLDFLRILGNELSKTVVPHREDLQYIPLQYLCEFIKNNDYDGVMYKSSVSDGHNLALFNDSKVKCRLTESHRIKQIDIKTDKIEQ